MLRGLIAGIVLTCVAVALTGYLIVRTGTIPANADDRPPKIERWAARMSLRATLERSAPRTENPLPVSQQNLDAGIKLYATDCAVCHGDSSANPTDVAKGLYQKPPQLAEDGVEDDPAGVTYWKIAHGIRWTGMPSFGRALSDKQVWQVTMFLQQMDHLPPAAQAVWKRVHA
jgi:thiosulfate dehydrogenase